MGVLNSYVLRACRCFGVSLICVAQATIEKAYPYIMQSISSTIYPHMNAIISSVHRALTLNVRGRKFLVNTSLPVCQGLVLPPPQKSFSSQVVPDGRRFRMAVLGSGPAGFYTAYKVMSSIADAVVDMYERLPVPYGLVRYGVAPDHPEVKVSRGVCASGN